MSSYDEIATRIAKIIVSPESAIGLIHGILSVPLDLGYLAYGYFDTGSHYSHETERIRIVRAIDSGILNHDRIIDAIQIVFNQFNKYTSENKQNKIYSRTISSVIGRIATNSVISSQIATAIAQRASFFVAVRGGVMGNILLVGGMRGFAHISPKVPHQVLKSLTNMMLCFLNHSPSFSLNGSTFSRIPSRPEIAACSSKE